MILAHGLHGRSDLPVPLWLALYTGAAAVLVSFVVLAFMWTKPRLAGADAGRPLPALVERFVDSRALRFGLQAAGLVFFVLLLAAAWAGTNSSFTNPASTWFYVWFWLGVIALSLVFGRIYRVANPLRILARGLAPLLYRPGREASLDKLAFWPAIAGLAGFLWLELVYPASDSPRAIAVFVTLYALTMAVAGAYYGPKWFERGDGFEVYFTLIARLSPFGRRNDGRIVVRSPLNGLLDGPSHGLTPVLLLILGSTTFDGVTRIPMWPDFVDPLTPFWTAVAGTIALAATVGFLSAMYVGAMWLTRPYLRKPRRGEPPVDLYGAFAHSLIPLALGYTIAHYFSFAIFQGQAGFLLATDPFGQGWDLFGTAGTGINYAVLSTGLIALVQVGAIIVGHIVAVVSAHDRALQIIRPDYKKTGQYPALALMVGYTVIGIVLVSSV
ncbi:hypothetical protein [Hoyosella subflava]|uniref:Fenitrothion hydrolase n=1 Tax=Hoyosella subflava (strain DSM 45089 / JCM 17490 / NBRC 109087 / DQS3-9A1) TaxID=443218 RepID=F6ELU8_HOYSD|nr:hypothetical protein [Hoyosella subflava]AEF41546.1 hypothetical protein AS9A_3101 [Hoyosella subflava DQS3-9A1]